MFFKKINLIKKLVNVLMIAPKAENSMSFYFISIDLK